jgi:hypothetical protein
MTGAFVCCGFTSAGMRFLAGLHRLHTRVAVTCALVCLSRVLI